MRSNNSTRFDQVPQANIARSSFDRSHGYKTTFDSGLLIPFFVDEALPGDTFSLSLSAFARLSTPLKPVMDNMFLETFFFFVPNRLIWTNWERFNGEQRDPADTTDYLVPQINLGTDVIGEGELEDYFGLPTEIQNLSFNALHNRAYALIWNEWFRDENLQNSLNDYIDDGPDPHNIFALQRRGKRKDYFTSCLPFPQKGPAVEIPVGGLAPVESTGAGIPTFGNTGTFGELQTSIGSPQTAYINTTNAVDTPLEWGETALVADLAQATGVTINALRESFQIQRLFERDARGGTRYIEIIKSHFGVTSPDSRLQRPEYLGGGSSQVNMTIVPNTTSVDSNSNPQGNLAAYGTVSTSGHGFSKSFTEHGVIIGMLSVRADITYQQGLDRMFSRQTRYDFFWPAFAGLGEQEVLNKEIFADGTVADDAIFGYQERYAEYRFKQSKVTGQFRSTFAQSLDLWHLAQDFANLPTLSPQFIEDNPPIDRIVAVPSEPQFIFDSYIKLKCVRPMPTYGIPGKIDQF